MALALTGAARAQVARQTLLVLGDSLTAGYGLPKHQAFPARLQEALRARGLDVAVVDGGVSGDTSAGGLSRLDWVVGSANPDVAIVELGANDGLRGLDPKAMADNLDRILAKFQQRKTRVLLAGMKAPPNFGRDYAQDYEAVFPRLAEKYGAILYPFFLDGVAAQPDLNQPDGIHPNADGVAVIVTRILPYVEKLLAPA
jgi:acyl-CoA thioesterase-1